MDFRDSDRRGPVPVRSVLAHRRRGGNALREGSLRSAPYFVSCRLRACTRRPVRPPGKHAFGVHATVGLRGDFDRVFHFVICVLSSYFGVL